GNVQDLAHFHVRDIHLDKLGQVGGQAGDFQLHQVVNDLATLFFNAFGVGFVNEVQGHAGVQFGGLGYALEVCVDDDWLGRVTLKVFQNHVLGFAVNIQADDVRVKSFALEVLEQIFLRNAD